MRKGEYFSPYNILQYVYDSFLAMCDIQKKEIKNKILTSVLMNMISNCPL